MTIDVENSDGILSGQRLGENMTEALKTWHVAVTDENLTKLLNHLYNLVTDYGFIHDEVRSMCENEELEME